MAAQKKRRWIAPAIVKNARFILRPPIESSIRTGGQVDGLAETPSVISMGSPESHTGFAAAVDLLRIITTRSKVL
jgi:hypothetical protein